MVDTGYLDKFFVDSFTEFFKYHDSSEWQLVMNKMDEKIALFNKYVAKADFQKLTKKQMYEDYDALIANITKLSPHLKVRQQVCKINFEDTFRKFREEIDGYESSAQFAILIYRTLLICQDGHTSLISFNPLELLSDGKSMEECASIGKYAKLYQSKRVLSDNLPQLIYHTGKYYTQSEYKYKHISIPVKTEIIAINGLQPAEYLRNNIDKKGFLSWDFTNNWFYSEYLLQKNIATDSVLQLKFKIGKRKQDIDVKLTMSDTKNKINTNRSGNIPPPSKNGFVLYWQDIKTMYVRIPEMENAEFYTSEIAENYTEGIKKIIIDIRNNPGGSDGVWMKILPLITSNAYSIESEYAYNRAYKGKDTTFTSTENFNNLDFVSKKTNRNFGNKNGLTLNYQGKIYVLYNENTFSAAGSLVNMCYYSDKLVAVGVHTGRILGFGSNPMEFKLPNTKIAYRIEPVLDITASKTYQDIFHDNPEIKVNLRFYLKGIRIKLIF